MVQGQTAQTAMQTIPCTLTKACMGLAIATLTGTGFASGGPLFSPLSHASAGEPAATHHASIHQIVIDDGVQASTSNKLQQ